MRCRAAMFTVEGPPRRIPAERAVCPRAECADPRRGGVALGWIAENWPGLLAEIRRLLPDLDVTAGDIDAAEMLNRAVALARCVATADRRSTARHVAEGVHRAAGPGRQTAPDFRQDAVDHYAEAPAAAVLDPGRRRRWRPQPEPAAAEPAAGQRPRHHARTPSRHSVSGVELVDEELHARPRRRSRTRTHEPRSASRRRRPPTCGSGSKNTPTGR